MLEKQIFLSRQEIQEIIKTHLINTLRLKEKDINSIEFIIKEYIDDWDDLTHILDQCLIRLQEI